jgi:hypothetical protein
MFATRHEQELAEIKALSYDLRDRVQEGLEQVEDISNEIAPPLIAFVHIPKTGGSTITSMFVRAYSKAMLHDAGNCFKGSGEKQERKLARVANARATMGHITYGLYRKHLPADTRYVTFLREPVGRVISHWYRHRRRTNTFRDEQRPFVTDTIEEAIEIGMPEVNNLATRLLCGVETPYDDLPADALEQAKANLADFAFVGIQERFDESIALLQRTLGMGLVPYGEPQRVSRSRAAREEITKDQRAVIAEHNRLDAELHEFGKGMFEEALAAAGDGLAADVERLRELNAATLEEDEAEFQAACDLLERELPPGTVKPASAIRAASKAAGISDLALGRAIKRVGVDKNGERDDAGRRTWRRT